MAFRNFEMENAIRDAAERHRGRSLHCAVFVGICVLVGSSAAGEEAKFVRGGILIHGPGKIEIQFGGKPLKNHARGLDAGRRLALFDWKPGGEYRLHQGGRETVLRAPLAPAPYLIRTVPLEDASQAAAAGVPPDAVVKFAPDSRRLAIGSFGGWLRVVDCYTGKVLHERRIAEGMIKTLAWSHDGRILFAGEQGPDGNLLALDADKANDQKAPSYRVLWSFATADDVDRSRPAPNDRYGIYSLPAVSDLQVLADGRVFLAANHSWSGAEQLKNRAAIYSLTDEGEVLWKLPRRGAVPLSIQHFAVDPAGRKAVFLASQSQAPTPKAKMRPGTLYQLDGGSGDVAAEFPIDPLTPHFSRVESWDSVALSADASRAAVGLADGRALLLNSTDTSLSLALQFDLGTPLLVGNIPVAASVSYTRFFGDRLYLQTQNTHIPFGSDQAANQAPSAHQGSNTITVTDEAGEPLWRYRGPYSLTGHWSDRSSDVGGRWLVTACRELPGAAEPGQFGFLLFDLTKKGGGSDKLVFHYPTVGPVLFNADISPNGQLVAVVEAPALAPAGQELYGTYQVHVVH